MHALGPWCSALPVHRIPQQHAQLACASLVACTRFISRTDTLPSVWGSLKLLTSQAASRLSKAVPARLLFSRAAPLHHSRSSALVYITPAHTEVTSVVYTAAIVGKCLLGPQAGVSSSRTSYVCRLQHICRCSHETQQDHVQPTHPKVPPHKQTIGGPQAPAAYHTSPRVCFSLMVRFASGLT